MLGKLKSVSVIILLLSILSSHSHAEEMIRLNFSGTSIKDVLKVVNKKTKHRFLFDDRLLEGRTISFYAEEPIPLSSLHKTLTTILAAQDLSLVKIGKGDHVIYKVVELSKASTESTPIYKNENIDEIPDSEEVVTVMYELQYLAPTDLEKPFSKITSIPNSVTAIEGTRILRITDIAVHVKKLVSILQSMDEKSSSIESATIKLKHVSASNLVQELKPMIDVENNKMRNDIKNRIASSLKEKSKRAKPGSSPVSLDLKSDFLRPIVVSPIDRLNSVFLSGTAAQLATMKLIINNLDIPEERRSKIHFVDIKYGEAETIARALSQLFNQGGGNRTLRRDSKAVKSKSGSGPVFNADPIKNRILILASESEMKNISEVLKKLDQVPEDSLLLKSYSINHADPEEVYNIILRMYAPLAKLKNIKKLPLFQISLDSVNYALWVRCSEEIHEEVKAAIEKIDIDGAEQRVLLSYPLEYADVTEASRMLKEVLSMNTSKRKGGKRGQPQQGEDIITVDRLNSTLLIFALERTHTLIKEALKTIDVSSDGGQSIRYYRVKHIALVDAVNVLNHLFSFKSSVQTPGLRVNNKQTEKLILDENSGQIIIIASMRTHKKVEETLSKVDVLGLGNNILRYYPIENTTSTEAAKTIQQLFGLPMTAPRGARNPSTGRGLALLRNAMVIPNIESNTVIVNAPETTHKSIAELLASMNKISKVDKMTVQFYTLENTNAQDIAGEIAELFSLKLGTGNKETQTRGRNLRNTSKNKGGTVLRPARPNEEEQVSGTNEPAPKNSTDRNSFFFNGEPTIIPEVNLNSVILVAPGYLHEEVSATIKKMDKRRPQVMVEVAILEVAEGSDLDLGVELSRITGHSAGMTQFGLSTPDPSKRFPNDGPLNPSLQGLVTGFIRADGSMPVILHALKTNNNLNIQSTPSLLVNDNETATFSSLQEEPTTSTSQGTATTKISFAGFVQAGTSLTITPHISQGKYIRLEVNLSVESFTGEAVAPGIPPPKSSNSLITSVTVPDENLAIVGGMVSEKSSEIVRKVPLLGDIPILGNAFKKKTKGKVKSRLYLFIKPKILRDEGFEDLKEISREKQKELQSNTKDKNLKDENALIEKKESVLTVSLKNTTTQKKQNRRERARLR